MSEQDHATGYNCATCGHHHEFAMWVYAHWSERLKHECDCSALHSIFQGKASVIQAGRKRVRDAA